MYITYCRNQRTVDLEDKTSYRLSVTGGDYRPTWLIRVSDWKRVPGEAAVDGYHTLSYCWEQSGEVVKREEGDQNEYTVIDHGEHCIVEGYDVDVDYINGTCLAKLERCDVEEEVDSENKERNSKYVTWCEPMSEKTTLKHVTYEELLQQLCKDFQVEYLWYDKVCIDQSDKKHKLHQINEMHKIYSNARYTIALIPEVIIWDPEDFNEKVEQYGNCARRLFIISLSLMGCWWTRSWTLEELMVSKRILMVGTDTNMFQHSLHTPDAPPTAIDIFSESMLDFGEQMEKTGGSVNQALAQAHFRTSTKPHDMIFALKNTFGHMFDDIKISYSTDVQTAFNNFYRNIATKDLSILCFGSNRLPCGKWHQVSTMGDYNLPSWTGVAGCHVRERANITTHPQLSYTINKSMKMNIKTNRYWEISITKYEYGPYCSPTNKYTALKKQGVLLEQIRKISSARLMGKWTDMVRADKDTVLTEWSTNMNLFTKVYMTHYHDGLSEKNALTQLRPLSLTEDCEGEKCIVLPILLETKTLTHKKVDEYKYAGGTSIANFILPVFCKCSNSTSEQYKAVGIYLVGNHKYNKVSSTFNWNHCIGRDDVNPIQNPKDILNMLFENNCHEIPKEFIVV
ncbi:hypothetical protein INT45_004600 [Circinella minor]|uniref:Heterokaryon incompatibility domain-containing protein n=1 Tax=Circinella minor TaxID=1195481 RepID=A0A8H7VE63_9FUNG|nr:hypothetical protein INT45_004600 [Circinella minor]